MNLLEFETKCVKLIPGIKNLFKKVYDHERGY